MAMERHVWKRMGSRSKPKTGTKPKTKTKTKSEPSSESARTKQDGIYQCGAKCSQDNRKDSVHPANQSRTCHIPHTPAPLRHPNNHVFPSTGIEAVDSNCSMVVENPRHHTQVRDAMCSIHGHITSVGQAGDHGREKELEDSEVRIHGRVLWRRVERQERRDKEFQGSVGLSRGLFSGFTHTGFSSLKKAFGGGLSFENKVLTTGLALVYSVRIRLSDVAGSSVDITTPGGQDVLGLSLVGLQAKVVVMSNSEQFVDIERVSDMYIPKMDT